MGCCESKEKKGSYLVTVNSTRNIRKPRKLDPKLTKENLDKITQFLELDDCLKLLKLNRMTREMLPEYIKLMEVIAKLKVKNENELDINDLLTDIWK